MDTFPLPKKQQVFYLGTNNPSRLSDLRKKILSQLNPLPDMGEYMHRSYFDGSYKYCKDTFLIIKYFGTSFLPKLLSFKRSLEEFLSYFNFIQKNIFDIILQLIASIFPDHLPKIIRDYRDAFEHHLILLTSDDSIQPMNDLLDYELKQFNDFQYFICTEQEGKDVLLHRYVAGAAPAKFMALNQEVSGEMLPLDIALPRNINDWNDILTKDILAQMSESFQMAHFLCMVFHLDFVVKKGVDINNLKETILKTFDSKGIKYPAEHNVGHLYKADKCLETFYRELDPTNTFNAGIGKMSKKKQYR